MFPVALSPPALAKRHKPRQHSEGDGRPRIHLTETPNGRQLGLHVLEELIVLLELGEAAQPLKLWSGIGELLSGLERRNACVVELDPFEQIVVPVKLDRDLP